MNASQQSPGQMSILTTQQAGFSPCPAVMTEEELIQFLRISAISNAKDHHNVVENLKRLRNLPRIHLCNRTLYPKAAIEEWIQQQTITGN